MYGSFGSAEIASSEGIVQYGTVPQDRGFFETVFNRIREKYRYWITAEQDIPIYYDNVDASGVNADSMWARVTIIPVQMKERAVASTKTQLLGLVIVQIFIPIGVGMAAAYRIISSIETGFKYHYPWYSRIEKIDYQRSMKVVRVSRTQINAIGRFRVKE